MDCRCKYIKSKILSSSKDYSNALTAAQSGISNASGDMRYKPGSSVSGIQIFSGLSLLDQEQVI